MDGRGSRYPRRRITPPCVRKTGCGYSLKPLEIGARVIETASRVSLAFAAACSEAPLLRHLATALAGP